MAEQVKALVEEVLWPKFGPQNTHIKVKKGKNKNKNRVTPKNCPQASI